MNNDIHKQKKLFGSIHGLNDKIYTDTIIYRYYKSIEELKPQNKIHIS